MLISDKVGIIFGVANKRSIAWATAQALHQAGARLAFAYQGERLKENVERLTSEEMPGSPLMSCDVTKQEEVDEAFARAASDLGRLDFVIHSIAFAPREALEGEYLKVDRDGFLAALEVSAYSCEGRVGIQRALPGSGSRPKEYSRECDQRRANSDVSRSRRLRLEHDAEGPR